METESRIASPQGEDDKQGAKHVFDEFFVIYQPVLMDVESYLKNTMEKMDSEYASAYKPWFDALENLLQGVFLTVKKIPLPDTDSFIDAIKLFTFDSAIQFLYDLCLSARIKLSNCWAEQFQKHIHMLLFSAAILFDQRQKSYAR